MKIQTSRFGEMEVDEKIIVFENGLLGFEDVKKYVLLNDADTAFYWLQSVEKPDLALPCMTPYNVCEDYEPVISEEVFKKLELENDDDALLLCVVVIPQDISKTTINLRAPVIINTANCKAEQVILEDNRYEIRHFVFKQ